MKIIPKTAFFWVPTITANAQNKSYVGGASNLLPDTININTNVDTYIHNKKATQEIHESLAFTATYSFLDSADSFAKSLFLKMRTFRKSSTLTKGERLLTFLMYHFLTSFLMYIFIKKGNHLS